MPFSPNQVGLQGQRITGVFFEDRDGCPHKGIDISSSQTNLPFTAGIFGRVTFTGGAWNTVAVQPMDGSAIHIQYLHCQTMSVSPGTIVAPWTVLGTTGDTAPAGTNISGIHLHLQVQVPGTGQPCWALQGNPRNFVNPETHPTSDLVRGSWFVTTNWSVPGYQITDRSEIGFYGSQIGSRVIQQRIRTVTGTNGCRSEIRMRWPGGSVSAHGTNSLSFSSPAGTAQFISDSCGIGGNPTADAGSVEGLVLTSPNTLTSPEGTMSRMGLFTDDIILSHGFRIAEEEAEEVQADHDIQNVTMRGHFHPFAFDPFATGVALSSLPDELNFGVAEKEVF